MNLGEAATLAGWATGRFLAKPNLNRTADLFSALTELGLSGTRALTLLRRRKVVTRTLRRATGEWVDQLHDEPLALAAGGPLSPWKYWARPWDGQWRVLCFDIPARPAGRRRKLLRFLRHRKFGLLQGSVWVCPDAPKELLDIFRAETEARTLLIWQAPTPLGISTTTLAQQAWDFAKVNQAYQKVLQGRGSDPGGLRPLLETTKLWHRAIRVDPLLPSRACPDDYLGFRATEHLEKMWSKFHHAGT